MCSVLLFCPLQIIITKKDYLWFRPELAKNETSFDIEGLGVPVHNWARMKLAWLAPGEKITWQADIKRSNADYCEQLLHLAAMVGPAQYHIEGEEERMKKCITLELSCDGEKIMEFTRYVE